MAPRGPLKFRVERIEPRTVDANVSVVTLLPVGGEVVEVTRHGPFMVSVAELSGLEVGSTYELVKDEPPEPEVEPEP